MIFFDTETCGLYGMPVLIQYAEDDGEIKLYSPWGEPISETLKLIEYFCTHPTGICGFNLAFDWFQLCKLYTVLSLYADHSAYPIDIVDELAMLEPLGRDGPCLKPVTACDIMLFARKGPYQSTMDREDIRIRRVPTALAWQLADELERRIPLAPIYFAKKKDKFAKKWDVKDIEDEFGEIHPDFKDVVLAFRPSSALKALVKDVFKVDDADVLLYGDVELDDYPEEIGYAPYALAVGTRNNWRGSWPEKIARHHGHWAYHDRARKYASDDVKYTRDLYKYFKCPVAGDDDSILACMVAAVRWRGFKIDRKGLEDLQKATLTCKSKMGANGKMFDIPTTPDKARWYITEHMDATEKLIVEDSTKKVLLQEISGWKSDCPTCKGEGTFEDGTKCETCGGTGEVPHKSANRAQEVLEARQAQYEYDLYGKFLLAGRFHASFNVIGALSSRMSGGDGLNAQGVKKTKAVRSKFPLAWDNSILCGGDFSAFEVTLAEASYKDPNLRKQLLTCEGCGGNMERVGSKISAHKYLGDEGLSRYIKWRMKKEKGAKNEETIAYESFENDFICKNCGSNKGKKIHALFGMHVFPEYDYEGIKATEGTKDDKYTKSKSAVFAMFYGGTDYTLKERLGVPTEVALAALARFHKEFPGVKKAQLQIINAFCSMRQPAGLGSKVEWHEPADYIESMFGFRRYFTLENTIARTLFVLANKPPATWRDIKIRVQRREKSQTAMGAVQSALYGAAFGIQAANTRAAANHVIQSSGATVTKFVQRKIWDLQPSGISDWCVQPMNIHDEIMCPTVPSFTSQVKEVVDKAVENFRSTVPLIKMDWVTGLKTWAEKG
jgi:DNA polymerase family A